MTNYQKKRKRQNGRQGGMESPRQSDYRKGYQDGQSELIRRYIEAGILPDVNFELAKKYMSENLQKQPPSIINKIDLSNYFESLGEKIDNEIKNNLPEMFYAKPDYHDNQT